MSNTASSNRQAGAALLALIFIPFVVYAPALLGHLIADPTLLYASIPNHWYPGPLGTVPTLPTIDPNIAYTSHALGYRAMLMWLHGNVPWWNHFEGTGVPLAGEMQSAALFPFVLLLRLHNGLLLMHICLLIIAGISTWALMRKLGCTQLAALAAGLAFEFNGTYAWLANAVINPIAFMPMALIGIETIRERIQTGERGGSAWLTIGIAASLYAGFPEVAYLDGLLILLWTLVRMPAAHRGQRLAFLLRVVWGGMISLAIAAPILVAFGDYLLVANTGNHAEGFSTHTLKAPWLLALLMPYAFGGIFQNPAYFRFWEDVGGYAGCILSILALYSVFGKSLRPLRIALAAWIVVTLGLTYDAPGSHLLRQLVPGLQYAMYYRYFPPSWEFGLCVLAALALSDLARGERVRQLAIATIAIGGSCVLTALITLHYALPLHTLHFEANAIAVGGAMVVILLCTWLRIAPGARACVVASLMACELAAYFFVPILSLPSRGEIDLDVVRFLQANLGFQRFATLGPIAPNYGSYFGIASVNHNDLPISNAWSDYVVKNLDSNTPPILFTGTTRLDPTGPSAASMMIAHLDAYAGLGVRYIVVPPNALDTPDFASFREYLASSPAPRLHEVYRDPIAEVYELSNPASYVSAPGCAIIPASRDVMTVDCPAGTSLTRLETYMPGWDVRINGTSAPLRPAVNGLFQEIDVPKGKSTVVFSFVPPYMSWALILFVFGWVLFIVDLRPYKSRPKIRPDSRSSGTVK